MALDDPLSGKKLGDYTIQGLLGRGGMSRVYRGYDENLDRYAAVKVISGDFVTTTEEEYTRRFQSEARAIARLRHSNIVGVYQFGRTEGIYYMAQVFLEGKDLRSLIKEYADRHQRIPPDEVLRIIRDVGGALDYAHEQGVIHRDIKPSNIMLEKKTGRAILMDFGLALSVQEGTMGDTFGSAHYIAPEQAVSSAKAVPQSDLYSLGIVLYEMLAGRVPFDDPSVMSVALKHLNELPPPPTMYNPDLPPAVEGVIMRVLDKDPKRRHATGKELIEDLERAFHLDRPGDAPGVRGAPPVVDMLDSQTRPPLPWWQQQQSSEHPRPSPSTAAKMREQEESATGGLAKRFARRKERKEEEAALQSMTEDNLQLDDASLDFMLGNMPDPSDIGLVGEGATGITHPERPSQMSRPSMPGMVLEEEKAETQEKKRRRRRPHLGVLLPVILVLAILVGGLYLGGQFGGGGDGDDENQPTLTNAEQRQTATAIAAAVIAAVTEETPEVTPRQTVTEAPTAEPTGEGDQTKPPTEKPASTDEPTEKPEPTDEPTATETFTETPTKEASPSATVAETTTEIAAETPTREGTAIAEVNRSPNMRAIYQGGEFLLLNLSGKMLDISKVSFEQEMPDGTERSVNATIWNRTVVRPERMLADSCYQLLTGEADQTTPESDICPFFLGFFRTTVIRNHFWVSTEPDAVFTVHYEGIDGPLAECSIAANQCDFYVGPDAGEVVVVAPTPFPTAGPISTGEAGQEPNIRLVYNRDNFLLINLSEEAINISELVFKQELPTGSERLFMAAEWDEKQGLIGETASLRAGGCYELVSSEGTLVTPSAEVCESFLGWFRSYNVELFFWISNQTDAVFSVELAGDSESLALCPISAGECSFYLPPPEE